MFSKARDSCHLPERAQALRVEFMEGDVGLKPSREDCQRSSMALDPCHTELESIVETCSMALNGFNGSTDGQSTGTMCVASLNTQATSKSAAWHTLFQNSSSRYANQLKLAPGACCHWLARSMAAIASESLPIVAVQDHLLFGFFSSGSLTAAAPQQPGRCIECHNADLLTFT